MSLEEQIEDWQQRLNQSWADSYERREAVRRYLEELKHRLLSKAILECENERLRAEMKEG